MTDAATLDADDDAAADGLLLVEYACRLAVKNGILIAALREGVPLDRAAAAAHAAAELEVLAAESFASAARMVERRAAAKQVGGAGVHEHDYRRIDAGNLLRREVAYRAVAERALRWSRDADELDALVELARAAAWDEVATAIEARLAGWRPIPAADARPGPSRDVRRHVTRGLVLLALRRRPLLAARLLARLLRGALQRP